MNHGHLYVRRREISSAGPKTVIAILIFAAACALRFGARYVPGFAERAVTIINPLMLASLGRVTGLFNFSIVEILIYLLIIIIPVHLFVILFAAFRRESDAGKRMIGYLTNLLILAALIFFLYEAGEDICFYRVSFSDKEGFGRGSYTTEELTEVCKYLTEECNGLAGRVERTPEKIMVLSADIETRITEYMRKTGETYPTIAGPYYIPKGLIVSYLLSVTDLSGIYSAYTNEANYNRDMPDYNKPFTMSHELAHTHGVLGENDANFIAYLNCMNALDSDIRYSGALMGWIYCTNELAKRDQSAYDGFYRSLDAAVRSDLSANSEFWARYKSPVTESAKKFNDSFLKSHGQKDGTESYSKVVDLIVSYELKK